MELKQPSIPAFDMDQLGRIKMEVNVLRLWSAYFLGTHHISIIAYNDSWCFTKLVNSLSTKIFPRKAT